MTGVEFTPTIRRKMLERDGFRCVRCGRYFVGGLGLDAHHRKLRSRGGLGTLENGISLCGSGTTGCHGFVHAHPEEATAAGWMVSRWADPATVPWKTWMDFHPQPAGEATGSATTPDPPRDDLLDRWAVPGVADRVLGWEWEG